MGCFVDSWELTGTNGTSNSPSACTQVVTRFTVPAEDRLEETYPWGAVKADKYTMTVAFTYKSQSAFANFQVK